MKFSFLLVFVCGFAFLSASANAQRPPWRETFISWEDFAAEYLADDFEEEDHIETPLHRPASQLLETLEERYLSPFNLNTATREDLLTLDFLTTAQIDSILSYRQKLRAFSSLGDLMLVHGLHHKHRRWLSLFVVVGDTLRPSSSWRQRFLGGRHTLDGRIDLPLYKRAGFIVKNVDEFKKNPRRHYLGAPMGNTLRHRYSWRNTIRYGFTLQNDIGEPFAAYGNRPYDHTSIYFSHRRPDNSAHLLFGDFRAHFGLGLLQGSTRFFHPFQGLQNLPVLPTRLRPHTSADEVKFLRGAAYSGKWRQWHWQTFVSHRRLDARLEADTVRSFQTSGLHRSLTEIERRRNVTLTSVGAHGEWRTRRLHLAFNLLHLRYGRPICPTPRLHNRYGLRGHYASGVSFDHGFYRNGTAWQGEVAIDDHGHHAISQRLRFSPHSRWTLLLQGRSFSSRFVAPSAQTEQAGSTVQNENGLSVAASHRLSEKSEISGFIDVFHHPSPTFRADLPSSGMNGRLEYEWSGHPLVTRRFLYSFRTRQRNITGHRGHLEYISTHRLRYQQLHTLGRLMWQWALDAAAHHRQTRPTPVWGAMLSSRLRCRLSPRIHLSAFASLFSSHDHDTRLYAYTPQLKGVTAFSAFAHTGIATVLTTFASFGRRWEMGGKWSFVRLFDRPHIGTGMQRIDASSQNDLSFQLRHIF